MALFDSWSLPLELTVFLAEDHIIYAINQLVEELAQVEQERKRRYRQYRSESDTYLHPAETVFRFSHYSR